MIILYSEEIIVHNLAETVTYVSGNVSSGVLT